MAKPTVAEMNSSLQKMREAYLGVESYSIHELTNRPDLEYKYYPPNMDRKITVYPELFCWTKNSKRYMYLFSGEEIHKGLLQENWPEKLRRIVNSCQE